MPDTETQNTPGAVLDEAVVGQALGTDEQESETQDSGRNVDSLLGVKLDVRVVLGRSRMPISELLNLTRGSVIELDRKVGDPVDIMINDRLVARGDLVKVQGDLIGVALREIVKDFIADA